MVFWVLQTVQRTLNRLSDPDLKTRRKALEMLLVCLLEDDGVGSIPPLDVLQVRKSSRIQY